VYNKVYITKVAIYSEAHRFIYNGGNEIIHSVKSVAMQCHLLAS